MRLTFASYNIHKAVGLDRRRDPERILAVLREIDADVIALQEADRRFGSRASVISRQALADYTPWQAAALGGRPDSIGWHGNALLVRRGIEIVDTGTLLLPTLEPRGAVRADLLVQGRRIRIAGMHLDLSGLRRRHQIRAVLRQLAARPLPCPTVLLGDFNEWARLGGCLGEFPPENWQIHTPGRSFPSRRPLAMLDRIVSSRDWTTGQVDVHHSALAARASDHLPVYAQLSLPDF